jgi:hypothetical protein
MISQVREAPFICRTREHGSFRLGRKLDRCPTVARMRASQSFDALPPFPGACFTSVREPARYDSVLLSFARHHDAGTYQ